MTKFNTPVRTAQERQDHKGKLNEIFARIGTKGRISAQGLKDLHDNRVEIAATIVELIQDDLAVVDPTPFLVDTVSQGFMDTNLFQKLEGTLKVVNRAYGSKPFGQRLTSSQYNVTTSMKEIDVTVPLEDVAAGRITASQVVEGMAFAISRYRTSLVLDAIDAAVTATADPTGVAGYNLRYSGLTDTNLAKAVDGLRDGGDAPTIFGRHIALYPAIRNFTGWADSQKSDIMERGQVGAYVGAPIVTLIDKYTELLGGHQVAANRVWCASANKGAWFIDKDVTFLNWATVDERSATFSTGIRLENGVFVHTPYRYRVIEV